MTDVVAHPKTNKTASKSTTRAFILGSALIGFGFGGNLSTLTAHVAVHFPVRTCAWVHECAIDWGMGCCLSSRTYIHTYIHTDIHAYAHTHRHTRIRTYTHTYTHTHIHTGMYK